MDVSEGPALPTSVRQSTPWEVSPQDTDGQPGPPKVRTGDCTNPEYTQQTRHRHREVGAAPASDSRGTGPQSLCEHPSAAVFSDAYSLVLGQYLDEAAGGSFQILCNW
jgi:hypothetical protein